MKQQITSHYNLFSHLSKKLQGPLWWIIETATKQCPDKIGKINVLLVFAEIYAKMGHTWHHQEGSTNTGTSCGKWTVTNSSEVWQLDRLEVNDLSPACQRHSAVLQRNTWLLCVYGWTITNMKNTYTDPGTNSLQQRLFFKTSIKY